MDVNVSVGVLVLADGGGDGVCGDFCFDLEFDFDFDLPMTVSDPLRSKGNLLCKKVS